MASILGDLSAQQLRKAASIRERIEKLEKQLAGLVAGSAEPSAARAAAPKQAAKELPKPKRRFSAATRAKMSQRLKARWAKAKASGKKSL